MVSFQKLQAVLAVLSPATNPAVTLKHNKAFHVLTLTAAALHPHPAERPRVFNVVQEEADFILTANPRPIYHPDPGVLLASQRLNVTQHVPFVCYVASSASKHVF